MGGGPMDPPVPVVALPPVAPPAPVVPPVAVPDPLPAPAPVPVTRVPPEPSPAGEPEQPCDKAAATPIEIKTVAVARLRIMFPPRRFVAGVRRSACAGAESREL